LIANSEFPLIIGHRGASAVAPENTIVAFKRGLSDGADGIEFDVRLSRDGVPVVIHDANLKRTGSARAVADITSAELSRCDVGSWFNRAYPLFGRAEYAEQYVPTLEETLTTLKASSRANWVAYAELKIDRGQEYRELARAVANLVSNHNLEAQVVVISFNLKALALIKKYSSIRTAAHGFASKHRKIAQALDCGASEILFHRLFATRRAIEAALAAQLTPVVWTVDATKWIERAQECGIHGLITNDPAKMLRQRDILLT